MHRLTGEDMGDLRLRNATSQFGGQLDAGRAYHSERACVEKRAWDCVLFHLRTLTCSKTFFKSYSLSTVILL